MLLLPKCSKSEDWCCIASVPTGWAGAVCCTGAAHGLTASFLTSWAQLLQLWCPLPCTDLHLCPKLSSQDVSQGVQQKPWAFRFLLGWNTQPHIYYGRGKIPQWTEQELWVWVFKRLIPLNMEDTQGLGLCSLSPWLHSKILSPQDASSVFI